MCPTVFAIFLFILSRVFTSAGSDLGRVLRSLSTLSTTALAVSLSSCPPGQADKAAGVKEAEGLGDVDGPGGHVDSRGGLGGSSSIPDAEAKVQVPSGSGLSQCGSMGDSFSLYCVSGGCGDAWEQGLLGLGSPFWNDNPNCARWSGDLWYLSINNSERVL